MGELVTGEVGISGKGVRDIIFGTREPLAEEGKAPFHHQSGHCPGNLELYRLGLRIKVGLPDPPSCRCAVCLGQNNLQRGNLPQMTFHVKAHVTAHEFKSVKGGPIPEVWWKLPSPA